MNNPETVWRRLVRQAAPSAAEPVLRTEAPPWFAQRVVRVWQSSLATRHESAWEQISGRSLAVALVIMVASLLVLVRPVPSAQPWEVLASESVISAVLPQ
jgi:hypothetical protein